MSTRLIKNILIIGAGTMGWQIAQIFAQKKKHVFLADTSANAIQKAKELTINNLDKRIQKGKMNRSKKEDILHNLEYIFDWRGICSQMDLIIEAIPEVLEIKQALFTQIFQYWREGIICATNSSSFTIENILNPIPENEGENGEFKNFAQHCMNIHFSNPPLRLHLVELHAFGKNLELENLMKLFFRRMHYDPIIIEKPVNGFVMNRIFAGALIEAFWLLEHQVCKPEDLDLACTAGLNWPMGIARLADMIGLDVIYNTLQNNFAETKNVSHKPSQFLEDLVKKGYLGWKTGQGIYKYPPKE